jgi:hypothetical protein
MPMSARVPLARDIHLLVNDYGARAMTLPSPWLLLSRANGF